MSKNKKSKSKRSEIFEKKNSLQKPSCGTDDLACYSPRNLLEDESIQYIEEEADYGSCSETPEDSYEAVNPDNTVEYDIDEVEEPETHIGIPVIDPIESTDEYTVSTDTAETHPVHDESILKYIPPNTYEENNLWSRRVPENDNRSCLYQQSNNVFGGGSGLYDSYDFSGGSWIMKALVNELSHLHNFMALEDQLYVYDDACGFFRLLPQDPRNRPLRALLSHDKIGNVEKKALSELYEWLVLGAPHVQEHQLRKNMHFINFADCAYNYTSGFIVKDRKDMFFRYALSIPYHDPQKEKSTGLFQKFIRKHFKNDPDTLREFRKFFGLALSNVRSLKTAFLFYGSSNTGKTTLLNLLNMLISPECSTCLSFSQLTNDSTVSQIIGKHLCTTSSIAGMSGRNSQRMDTFKSLVGNDLISVRQNGGVYANIRNRSLLVFACDYLPEITNIHEVSGFVSKIIIFPFKNVIPQEDQKSYAWEEIFRDTVGIVDFAIKGIQDLYQSNFEFHESKAMRAAKEEFQGNLESFTLFAEEYLKPSSNRKLLTSELNTAYQKFCDLRSFPCLEINQWTVILKKIFRCKSMKASQKGKRSRGYSGITFKEKICELWPEWSEATAADAEDAEDEYIASLEETLNFSQTDKADDSSECVQDAEAYGDQDEYCDYDESWINCAEEGEYCNE